ncbi:Hypothetical predicted protein [Xyrichtys novacula]|uniref:Uncharacterized protein n=1 Tax=Xyrichtys novacula TaxID=13765 RepID=A0AAV1ENC9_XYRNO|nr:Hypothetical predicted protein [Xyrichtys novacula]
MSKGGGLWSRSTEPKLCQELLLYVAATHTHTFIGPFNLRLSQRATFGRDADSKRRQKRLKQQFKVLHSDIKAEKVIRPHRETLSGP